MEEIKKIEVQGQQYGVADMLMRSVMGGNAQVIEWSDSLNLCNLQQAGTYRIKGERLSNTTDNLPIQNAGEDNTIDAILQVLDSSLNSDEPCITQILTLSNRYGKDGDVYIRSAFGWGVGDWEPWAKLQTNIEVGQVNSLDSFIDNGIYSGVWTDGTPTSVGSFYDTFVMVVINNYAVSGPLGQTRSISQFKYSLGLDGTVTFKSRVGQGGDSISWGEWKEMSGGGSRLVSYEDPYNGFDGGIFAAFTLDNNSHTPTAIGTGVTINTGTYIGKLVHIGNPTNGSVRIGTNGDEILLGAADGIVIGSSLMIVPNKGIYFNGVSIGTNAYLGMGEDYSTLLGTDVGIGLRRDSSNAMIQIGHENTTNRYSDIKIGTDLVEDGVIRIHKGVIIDPNITITYSDAPLLTDSFSISVNSDRVLFNFNGKTAELPLT